MIGFLFLSWLTFSAQSVPLLSGNSGSIAACNKHISIPRYFPYISDESGLFLTVKEDDCGNESIKIFIGHTPDCTGQNVCGVASFLSMRIDGDLATKLEQSLSSTAHEVSLAKNIVGYYAPSKCYAYCTEAKLVWFTQGQINILGSKTSKNKDSDIAEFTKSANSLIEKITAPD